MPLLRTEQIHGWTCKFYDGGVVMVGTTANWFTIKVAADEASGGWPLETRVRAD